MALVGWKPQEFQLVSSLEKFHVKRIQPQRAQQYDLFRRSTSRVFVGILDFISLEFGPPPSIFSGGAVLGARAKKRLRFSALMPLCAQMP